MMMNFVLLFMWLLRRRSMILPYDGGDETMFFLLYCSLKTTKNRFLIIGNFSTKRIISERIHVVQPLLSGVGVWIDFIWVALFVLAAIIVTVVGCCCSSHQCCCWFLVAVFRFSCCCCFLSCLSTLVLWFLVLFIPCCGCWCCHLGCCSLIVFVDVAVGGAVVVLIVVDSANFVASLLLRCGRYALLKKITEMCKIVPPVRHWSYFSILYRTCSSKI